MMDPITLLELGKLHQQELIDEASREHRTHQLGATRQADNPRYVGAVIERFVRQFLPVRLVRRQSTS